MLNYDAIMDWKDNERRAIALLRDKGIKMVVSERDARYVDMIEAGNRNTVRDELRADRQLAHDYHAGSANAVRAAIWFLTSNQPGEAVCRILYRLTNNANHELRIKQSDLWAKRKSYYATPEQIEVMEQIDKIDEQYTRYAESII